MDAQLIQKISDFSALSFKEAQRIIIDLAKQLTKNTEDIFYHISITLPELTQSNLDQAILTDIYRDIVIANETVDRAIQDRLLISLTESHNTIALMFQKEKEEKEKELEWISTIISIL